MKDSVTIEPSFDSCTFIPPSLATWMYAISVHGICSLVGGVSCGCLLYRVLQRNKKFNTDSVIRVAGVSVGILAAASIYIYRPLIERLSPNHQSTFIGPVLASTFGFGTFFKSINVAFGNYPEGADANLYTWLLWYVMMPEPTFAKGKLSQASRTEIVAKLGDFFFKIIALFLLLTVLMQHPPPYYRVMEQTDTTLGAWLLAVHVNGFFHLWLLYSFFAFCLDFSTITNYILSGGVRMEPGFCNPLLESRSFQETWGTRWNRPVNLLLKRTVYIPALKSGNCSRTMAAVVTFLASGLLHEYNFSIHNHRSLQLESGYRHGQVTVFFVFMGILMIAESWVWKTIYPRWLQTVMARLPSPITASLLTFLVAGLAERYFLRGWFQSGFVEAVAGMLPRMECRGN